MNNITCDVVKDIMPLCVDDACSDISKQLVADHINACAECKKLWDSYSIPSITNELRDDNGKMFQELTAQIKKKNRKKTILALIGGILISIILFAFINLIVFGLLTSGRENYVTIDIDNYGIYEGHVKCEKEDLRSGLYIFPEEISENAKNVDFLYSCEAFGFSVSYQQFLQCTYPVEEYLVEVDRLKNTKCEIVTKSGTVVNHVEYSETKFDYPAYIAAYGGLRIYEYALCNESTRTITYIFLQTISNDGIMFSKECLPREYRNGKELLDDDSMNNLNIYFYHLEKGIYQNFRD